ncbi:hypothetical protein [Umezawaea sp. Da 62-37]|uniref:hypothetical protein n=1 Tax=Umezawaea sp. Da 62-37 TaxID=3075927 RepID=UPI0028F6D855|nr:hypothetical protein [Umezawaea sp. Da 62-37]WNV83179.1 hypothetical protein RM788_34030 [Umezawaea sp. Da 62-37]
MHGTLGLTHPDLLRRMEGLVTLINAMDSLSESVAVWLNIQDNQSYGITHRLHDDHPWPIAEQDAAYLRPKQGEKIVYRRGSLWADLRGTEMRLATANALVVWSRLPRSVRADLADKIPLGFALRKVGAKRQTDPPVFTAKVGEDGSPRLEAHLTSTLLVSGRPWARTQEVLDQVIVEHREPSPEALPSLSDWRETQSQPRLLWNM